MTYSNVYDQQEQPFAALVEVQNRVMEFEHSIANIERAEMAGSMTAAAAKKVKNSLKDNIDTLVKSLSPDADDDE